MSSRSVAAPRAGRSLEGLVAPLRAIVAEAVDAAASALHKPLRWLGEASAHDVIPAGDLRLRSAWAVVAITLIEGTALRQQFCAARALAWFDGGPAEHPWTDVDLKLAGLADREDLGDLLPYLLDLYGRTSRLDVIRDASLHANRAARKEAGSFYTPADVVDFMVGTIASDPDSSDYSTEQWLDPACGSGVFLVGALRRHLSATGSSGIAFATTRLQGCDISPQACDFAAFSILAAVARNAQQPILVWRRIRANMVALDATDRAFGGAGANFRQTAGVGDSPLRLICNPPYKSDSGAGVLLADGSSTRALYLPFVQMAWEVAGEATDAAVVVVPLALAANRSADHRRCRTAMSQGGGSWTLLFFDRQPHALFGEDAKTRATIAIRRPGPAPAQVRTSSLLKWTSRQRASIFSEDRAISLGQIGVGRLVPKLGGQGEARLYAVLDRMRLKAGCRPEPTTATAQEIVGSQLSADVFVAGTAYNFLNIFRNYPDHLSWRGTLSASGIHRLRCADVAEADLVTALLTSRLAFWMWHAECDGFHVPAWFLAELPLLNIRFSAAVSARLAVLGRQAWAGLQTDVLCSVNRERVTFAFRPTRIGDIRSEIDRVILEAIGADPQDAKMLEEFETKVASIDGAVRLAKQRIEMEA